MTNRSTLPADKRSTHIFAVAAWLGLLCGFGDVFILILLDGVGWKNATLPLVPEMIWITPLFTMILFAGAGVALVCRI